MESGSPEQVSLQRMQVVGLELQGLASSTLQFSTFTMQNHSFNGEQIQEFSDFSI
jgi:hypothetical protein